MFALTFKQVFLQNTLNLEVSTLLPIFKHYGNFEMCYLPLPPFLSLPKLWTLPSSLRFLALFPRLAYIERLENLVNVKNWYFCNCTLGVARYICQFRAYRLDWTVLSMRFVWAQCWKLERRWYGLDEAMCLSCYICWRWHCLGNGNCSAPLHWSKHDISHLWGIIVYVVDVWHIHWTRPPIFAEEVSS